MTDSRATSHFEDGGEISVVRSEGRMIRGTASIYIICAGIFLLAFSIRVGLIFVTGSYQIREDSEVERVANSLARGHGFANAFGNTGPTAHMSPLYPLLLSVIYRHSASDVGRQMGQELLSCFLGGLTWGLIPLVAEIARLDRRVGIGAGLVGAGFCINRWAETNGAFETAMAGLACLLVVLCYMRCWYSHDFSFRSAILTGAASGLGMLASASLLSIIAGLLVMGYFLFRRCVARKYLRFAFFSVAVMFVVLFPWALRNYFALGSFVWTRPNLPLELRVSNNDEARANFDDNTPAQFIYHPLVNAEQRRAIKTMGELAYQRKLRGVALDWIVSHPKGFAWLTLQRIYYFWFPKMKRRIQRIALGFLTLCSLPALIFLLKVKEPLGYGLLTVLFAYPLVYYVVQAYPRYVYPIQWTLYLLSSFSMVTAFDYWKARQSTLPQVLAA